MVVTTWRRRDWREAWMFLSTMVGCGLHSYWPSSTVTEFGNLGNARSNSITTWGTLRKVIVHQKSLLTITVINSQISLFAALNVFIIYFSISFVEETTKNPTYCQERLGTPGVSRERHTMGWPSWHSVPSCPSNSWQTYTAELPIIPLENCLQCVPLHKGMLCTECL